jgi:hypothetical protein
MNRKILSLALFVVVASLLVFGLKYFHPWPNSHAAQALKSASVPETPPGSIPNDGLGRSGQAIQENVPPEQLMNDAWAMSGDGRIPAATLAFQHWTNLDLNAASNWLADHETDPAADHLIADVLLNNSVLKKNLDLSLRWGEVISDHDLRAGTLEHVLLTVGIIDPQNAIYYTNVESQDLSPEQKERIRTALRPYDPAHR